MKKMRMPLALALLLLSLFLLAFPRIRGEATERREERAVEAFRERSAALRVWQRETEEEPYPELREAAEAYNRELLRTRQAGLSEETMERPHLDLEACGLSGDTFGVVEIPACGVRLPLYLGASDGNLARGACVLGGTSLPLGGESTHTVIAGHRGWYAADMFRHLDKVQEGDEVLLQNPWETLVYRVREVKVISGADTEEILIRPGEDLLTLLTCRPWAGGWPTRLAVVCERTETD